MIQAIAALWDWLKLHPTVPLAAVVAVASALCLLDALTDREATR